jgi:predicted permease
MYAELPFQNGKQIRVIDLVEKGVAYSGNSVPEYIYHDFKTQVSSLQQVSAFKSSLVTVSISNQVRKYIGAYAEPAMFSLLGVPPLHGGVLTQQHIANREHVVMISESSALEMFGNTKAVVGKNVNIRGEAYRVIGVMPDSFKFPRAADLWLPLEDNVTKFNRSEEGNVSVFGSLSVGVTDKQLNHELSIFMDNLRSIHSVIYENTELQSRRFQDAFLGNAGEMMARSIVVAAILILLLASVNASNLLYLRALERKRESSIRLAIGASPSRLFLQMMCESVVICLISSAISIFITHFLLQYLNSNINSVVAFSVPFWWNFQLTPMLVFIAVAAALCIVLIAGIFPAWRMSNTKFVSTSLSEHKNDVTRSSKLIVIVEVFLASALLLVSAAFVLTVSKQNQDGLSFNSDTILSASLTLQKSDFDTEAKVVRYYQEFEHTFTKISPNSELAFSSALPVHNTDKTSLFIDGAPAGAEFPSVKTVKVSHEFFSTLQISVLQGRSFSSIDKPKTPTIAVVSLAFSKQFFGDESAVGKRIKFHKETSDWYEVVGVVENIAFGETFDNKTKNQVVFTSIMQEPDNVFNVLVKTESDPYDFTNELRSVAAQVNNSVAPFRVKSLADAIDQNRASILYITKMFVFLSTVALVLTLSGVYSVVSNIIISKSKEISIRIALGANYRAIFGFISSSILIQCAIGLVMGVGLASYLLTILARLQIVSFNPLLSIVLPFAFLAVVMVAITIPLSRVLQAPPSSALRQE